MSVTSIVQLKTDGPKTKLLIRHIPPQLTKAEFRDLILNEEDQYSAFVTYFSYHQGVVLRDAFGRVLKSSHPEHGCAHIAFKSPASCGQFYRKWHGKTLTDGAGISGKLAVSFALNQRIPPPQAEVPEAESEAAMDEFKRTALYQQFAAFLPKSKESESASPSGAEDLRVSPTEVINVLPSTLLSPKFADFAYCPSPAVEKTSVTPLVQYAMAHWRPVRGRDSKNKELQKKKPPKKHKQRENGAVDSKNAKKDKHTAKIRHKTHKEASPATATDMKTDHTPAVAVSKPERLLIKKREILPNQDEREASIQPSDQGLKAEKPVRVAFRTKKPGQVSIKDQLNAEKSESASEARIQSNSLEIPGHGHGTGSEAKESKKEIPPRRLKKPAPVQPPVLPETPPAAGPPKSKKPEKKKPFARPETASGTVEACPKIEFMSKSRKDLLASKPASE